jgi:hypothetical protein
MKKIVRLTESDLTRIVRRVMSEQNAQLADKIAKEMMQAGYGLTTDGYGNVWISFYKAKDEFGRNGANDVQVYCNGSLVYPADDAEKVGYAKKVGGGYYETGLQKVKEYCVAAGKK